ncbi:metal-dependent hydrolase [Parasphingorhabdus sp.]|uniref:metal-dependent hydrolase n=1 Tax=Parasphingorhabdus sp. TaxID=2709688 RepID=UPI003A955862
MPTIMSHAAVPLAGALILGRSRLSLPVIATGLIFAMLPDADVIGFGFGVEYADNWGRRGATHSLFFAAVAGLFATVLLSPERYGLVAAFLFVSMASHGLLDMLTDGGLGVAVFWPFEATRHFALFTPIAVSPIGISDFINSRGIKLLYSEAIWIWIPLTLVAAAGFGIRKRTSKWFRQNGTAR